MADMDYRLGKSLRIIERGETLKLECPKCNKKVAFSVFTNADAKLISSLPFISCEDVYFLVCPECAGVFGVENSKGRTFNKGEKLAIGNFDLKELKEFKTK